MSTSPPAIRPAARVPLRKLHGPTKEDVSPAGPIQVLAGMRPTGRFVPKSRTGARRTCERWRTTCRRCRRRAAVPTDLRMPPPRAPSAPSTSCTGILSRCALTYIAASRTSRRPNSRARRRARPGPAGQLIHDDPTSNRAQLLPLGFGQGIDPMHRRRRAIFGTCQQASIQHAAEVPRRIELSANQFFQDPLGQPDNDLVLHRRQRHA